MLREDSPRPLLFIACDDGFAPIKSLVEHAMAVDTAGQMHLHWIATETGGNYMQNLCRSWTDALDNFNYTSIVADAARDKGFVTALQAIVNTHPEGLANFDVYLAGPQAFVAEARTWLQQCGVPDTQLVVAEA